MRVLFLHLRMDLLIFAQHLVYSIQHTLDRCPSSTLKANSMWYRTASLAPQSGCSGVALGTATQPATAPPHAAAASMAAARAAAVSAARARCARRSDEEGAEEGCWARTSAGNTGHGDAPAATGWLAEGGAAGAAEASWRGRGDWSEGTANGKDGSCAAAVAARVLLDTRPAASSKRRAPSPLPLPAGWPWQLSLNGGMPTLDGICKPGPPVQLATPGSP